MNMKPALPRDPVDLGDRVILTEDPGYFHEGIRSCLDLKIAGYCPADLLWIDDRSIFLNDSFLFQRLYPHLYRYP